MALETTTSPLPTAHEAAVAAFADSSSAPSATETPTAAQPASATVTPATETAADSAGSTDPTATTPATESTTETPAKEPPKWRWQDILEHQRTKAATEAEARIRQEFAWAQEIPEPARAHAKEALQFAAWVEADPHAATQWLVEQVHQRTGQAPPAARSATPSELPEPDLVTADGTKLYSHEQMERRMAYERAQLERQFRDSLAPLEQDRQTRAARERTEALQSQVRQELASMRQRPHFTEHEAAIKAAMVEDPRLSLEGAYNRVLLETVIPSLQSSSSSQVVADMKTRAVAATVNPSRAQPTAPTSVIGNARAAAELAFRDG